MWSVLNWPSSAAGEGLNVFKHIISSHPLGCSVWFSDGHVFLTREPQGFLWPCQILVPTFSYEWRSVKPLCCGQTYYNPKGTNNRVKQIKYKAEKRDGKKWAFRSLSPDFSISVYSSYVSSKFLLSLESFWVGFFLLSTHMNPQIHNDLIEFQNILSFIFNWEMGTEQGKCQLWQTIKNSESLATTVTTIMIKR